MFWFTSDLHFSHKNIIKYCNRPFSSVEEMDFFLIKTFNSLISPNDIVFHLGDFCFKKSPIYFLEKLNGKWINIKGNHDYHDEGFILVKDSYFLEIDGFKFFLSHQFNPNWPFKDEGTYHLFGHCHGIRPIIKNAMDCGVDTNQMKPYSLEQVLTLLNK